MTYNKVFYKRQNVQNKVQNKNYKNYTLSNITNRLKIISLEDLKRLVRVKQL